MSLITKNHGTYLTGVDIQNDGTERIARNILIGEDGDDQLLGGKGDDILLGGTGFDTYLYRIGDGNDKIVDDDKRGKIVIIDETGAENESRTLGNFYKSGENVWKLPDGSTITLTHNSPWQIVLEDGSTIELDDNFQDGDFGIHLLDKPTVVVTANTIVGDLKPIDVDPEAAGVQIGTDEWGNVIVGSEAEPGKLGYSNVMDIRRQRKTRRSVRGSALLGQATYGAATNNTKWRVTA